MATPQFLNTDHNFAVIDRQWQALIALCADDAVFNASAPAISGWSVAQQVHHLALELDLIAREIGNLRAHPQTGAGLAPTHPFAMQVLEQGHFPRGSGQAPADVVPPAAPPRDETRAILESTRRKWDAIRDERDALSQSTATHPHPILGSFTCALWFRFIPIHTAHHLRIVRDILTAKGVPVPFNEDAEAVN